MTGGAYRQGAQLCLVRSLPGRPAVLPCVFLLPAVGCLLYASFLSAVGCRLSASLSLVPSFSSTGHRSLLLPPVPHWSLVTGHRSLLSCLAAVGCWLFFPAAPRHCLAACGLRLEALWSLPRSGSSPINQSLPRSGLPDARIRKPEARLPAA
jgi:hypothetical protein